MLLHLHGFLRFFRRVPGRRVVCAGLAGVYFFSNVVTVYSAEKAFWSDRREAVAGSFRQTNQADAVSPLQLARLTADAPVVSVPAVTSALLPPSFPQKSSHFNGILSRLAHLVAPHGYLHEIHFAGAEKAPFVIHVQDAHGIEEAQRNIAAMVESFANDLNARWVGMEGATGKFEPEAYRSLGDSELVRALGDHFLKTGYLTGPEFAALSASRPARLWGVEDPALYGQNLDALRESVRLRPAAEETLNRLAGAAESLEQRFFSPDLHRHVHRAADYAAGRLGLADYARSLDALRRNRRLGAKAPNLDLFLDVIAMESKLDFQRVEAERLGLIERLAQSLPPVELSALVDLSLRFRQGEISAGDYYRALRTAGEKVVSFTDYPQLDAYVRYRVRAEGIRRERLQRELSSLESAIESVLAESSEAKRLLDVRRKIALAQKLVRHEMSPADWESYTQRSVSLSSLSVELESLRKHALHAGEGEHGVLPDADLLRPFEDFCRAAVARNSSIAERLLEKTAREKSDVAVLVTGGFHTEGLSQLLREKGISYAVVSPRLDAGRAPSAYLDVFVHHPTPLEKLFRGEPISLAPRPVLEAVSDDPRKSVFQGLFLAFGASLSAAEAERAPSDSEVDAAVEEVLRAWNHPALDAWEARSEGNRKNFRFSFRAAGKPVRFRTVVRRVESPSDAAPLAAADLEWRGKNFRVELYPEGPEEGSLRSWLQAVGRRLSQIRQASGAYVRMGASLRGHDFRALAGMVRAEMETAVAEERRSFRRRLLATRAFFVSLIRLARAIVWDVPRMLAFVRYDRPMSNEPVWWADGNPFAAHENPEWPEDIVDTVVIGAGITGTGMAYFHSQAGTDESLVLLEKHVPAYAASGRNGGFVTSGKYWELLLAEIRAFHEKHYPEMDADVRENEVLRRATTQILAMQENARLVQSLIKKHGLTEEVEYQKHGWLEIAESEQAEKDFEEAYRQAQERGFEGWELWSPETIKEKTGIDSPYAGILSNQSGTLQPAKFVWNLLKVALENERVRLYTNTGVGRVERDADGLYVVHTEDGRRLRARRVAYATESYTPALLPEFEGLINPRHVQIDWNEPAPSSLAQGVGFTKGHLFSVKRPNGGLILGTDYTPVRDPWNFFASFLLSALEQSHLNRLFKNRDEWRRRVTRQWSGTVGCSVDGLAYIGNLDGAGQYMVGGMSGWGGAIGLTAARQVTNQMLNRADENLYPEEFFSPTRYLKERIAPRAPPVRKVAFALAGAAAVLAAVFFTPLLDAAAVVTESYSALVRSHPLIVKPLTAFGIGFAGDYIAQKIQSRTAVGQRPLNRRRLAYSPFIQMILGGLCLHWVFLSLEAMAPGTSLAAVAAKDVVLGVVWPPIYFFFFWLGTTFFSKKPLAPAVNRATLREALQKFRDNFWPAFWRATLYWQLFIHPINFLLIPLDFRVLLANLASIPWMAYMSVVAHRAKEADVVDRERPSGRLEAFRRAVVRKVLGVPPPVRLPDPLGLKDVLEEPGYSPEALINALKADDRLRALFDSQTGLLPSHTLEKHTLRVLHQFEKYFQQTELPAGTHRSLFRLMLALHDIGKPLALRQGDRSDQHAFTRDIIHGLRDRLPLPPQDVDFILALVDGDPIGGYLKGEKTTREAVEQVRSMARAAGLSPADFFNLLMIYYQSDAGSYTVDAGGREFLEHLFVYEGGEKKFDPATGRIVFSRDTARKADALESAVKESFAWRPRLRSFVSKIRVAAALLLVTYVTAAGLALAPDRPADPLSHAGPKVVWEGGHTILHRTNIVPDIREGMLSPADAIEMDVFFDEQGEPVVSHYDPRQEMWLRRIEGISRYGFGGFRAPGILSLEQGLAAAEKFGPGKSVQLDVKAGGLLGPGWEERADRLARAIREAEPRNLKVIVTSGRTEFLERLNQNPDWLHARRGGRVEFGYASYSVGPHSRYAAEDARRRGADWMFLSGEQLLKRIENSGMASVREWVDGVHRTGLKIDASVVNDPEAIQRLREAGVDSVTTDLLDGRRGGQLLSLPKIFARLGILIAGFPVVFLLLQGFLRWARGPRTLGAAGTIFRDLARPRLLLASLFATGAFAAVLVFSPASGGTTPLAAFAAAAAVQWVLLSASTRWLSRLPLVGSHLIPWVRFAFLSRNIQDAVVIGAGPAGIILGKRAKDLGLDKLTIFDKGTVGESWTKIPQEFIVDFHPSAFPDYEALPEYRDQMRSGEEIVRFLKDYVGHFGLAPHIREGVRIESVTPVRVGPLRTYEVVARDMATNRAEIVYAWNVVAATGIFGNPRRLGVPGEDSYPEKVFHIVEEDDLKRISLDAVSRSGRVVIVGGGNSAILLAMRLLENRDGESRVTLVFPEGNIRWKDRTGVLTDPDPKHRAKFEKLLSLETKSGEPRLILEGGKRVTKIGENSLTLKNQDEEEGDDAKKIDYDRCYVCVGFNPAIDFLEKQGIAVVGRQVQMNRDTFEGLSYERDSGALNIVPNFFVLGVDPNRGVGVTIQMLWTQVRTIAGHILQEKQLRRKQAVRALRAGRPGRTDAAASREDPASVVNDRALGKWGSDSRLYKAYTIWGVHWEMVFQAPVLLALAFDGGISVAFAVALSLASGYVFSGVHKGKDRRPLFLLGTALAGVFVAPAFFTSLGWPALLAGAAGNAALHSAYNFARLRGWLPGRFPLASLREPETIFRPDGDKFRVVLAEAERIVNRRPRGGWTERYRDAERHRDEALGLLRTASAAEPGVIGDVVLEWFDESIRRTLKERRKFPHAFAHFLVLDYLPILDSRVGLRVAMRFYELIRSGEKEFRSSGKIDLEFKLRDIVFKSLDGVAVEQWREVYGRLYGDFVGVVNEKTAVPFSAVRAIPRFEDYFETDSAREKAYFRDDFLEKLAGLRNKRSHRRLSALYDEAHFKRRFMRDFLKDLLWHDKGGRFREFLLDRLEDPAEILGAKVRNELIALLTKDLLRGTPAGQDRRLAELMIGFYRTSSDGEERLVLMNSLSQVAAQTQDADARRIVFPFLTDTLESVSRDLSSPDEAATEENGGMSLTRRRLIAEMELAVESIYLLSLEDRDERPEDRRFRDGVLEYMLKLAGDERWNVDVRSEMISRLDAFIEDGHERVIAVFLRRLEPQMSSSDRVKLLSALRSTVPDRDAILSFLRSAALGERTAYLIVRRYGGRENTEWLEGIVNDESLGISLRLYAFALALGHIRWPDEGGFRRDAEESAEEIEFKLQRMIDVLREPAEAFVRKSLEQDTSFRALFNDIWLQDEEAKVYVAASLLAMNTHLPFLRDAKSFAAVGRAVGNTKIRNYHDNAHTAVLFFPGFVFGGQALREANDDERTAALFYQIAAHELMHQVLMSEFRLDVFGLKERTIHEMLADLAALRFSEVFGIAPEGLIERARFAEHRDDVRRHRYRSTEEHEAGRAQLKMLGDAFARIGERPDYHRLLEAAFGALGERERDDRLETFVADMMGRYAGGEGPAAERGRADESFVVTLLSPKKAADILARVAPPASVLNLRAARRWGTDSRKYRLYTVFGVNWEMVFQAPVLLALLSGFDSPAVLVLLSLASAFVFAGVHKGRSGKARLVLVSLGILLAGALCAPALLLPAGLPAFALGVLLNAGLHSAYNLALLKGRLPRWASLFEGEKPVLSTSQRRSSGGDPSGKAEILPEMLFGGPAGPVRFDAARWDVSLSRLRDEALEKRRTASAGRRAVTAALGLPPAETPEDLVAEAYRRTAALHSRGGSLTDRTATPDAHMPRGLPGDVGRTDMELLAEFVLDVEEEFLGRRASRPSSASSTSAHPSGASFDRLFRLGAESYNGWVRERTGLAFADEALSRSWTSASRPAQETDLSSAAALVVEMSPAMVSDQMELSGTEITALEMLGGLADRIGSSEPAPKIVLLLHDPEGKTLGLSEAALRSRLENRLPEPQRERFRRNRSAVELTRTRQEWIRAGKIRVSRVLNSFNLSAADIYALDGGHWDLSGAEKTVRLILLLAGGLVRDLPARIGEEIRFIRLLNIQA